ncbi:hypothetical protein H632_c1574p0 [Helicosporidium sp. ATCC 50920]|nr:hypothetical protein H632_c1574p0 [Helicosporidium sp. ATCC 50920]|eukprot:KDD74098.1 hypothetical protein H632_c1574p0 [Helicosporidium sp. ATCC 50920]
METVMLLKVEGAPLPEPVKRKWTQEGSRPVNLLSHEDIDQKLSKAAQRRQMLHTRRRNVAYKVFEFDQNIMRLARRSEPRVAT